MKYHNPTAVDAAHMIKIREANYSGGLAYRAKNYKEDTEFLLDQIANLLVEVHTLEWERSQHDPKGIEAKTVIKEIQELMSKRGYGSSYPSAE